MILVPLTFHEDQNGYGTQFTIQNHPFINLRQIFSERTMLVEIPNTWKTVIQISCIGLPINYFALS